MNPIVRYANDRKQKVDSLLAQVRAGELTSEEAAQSLAGWELKNNPNIALERENSPHFSHEELYRRCLHDIESRLPGYDGIVPGRHL